MKTKNYVIVLILVIIASSTYYFIGKNRSTEKPISTRDDSVEISEYSEKEENFGTTPSPKATARELRESVSNREPEKPVATQKLVQNTPACPDKSNQYATVIDIKDTLGNVYQQSEYNHCSPTNGYFTVKKGQSTTISVSVDNSSSEPVTYNFVGKGFPSEWQSGNTASVTFDGNYLQSHLRVFVRNSDNLYRAPDYDDMIQITYTIVD